MWKHVWKGVWWKHFCATNACSLSSNSLLFPPPFSHLSLGANICVFVFFCVCAVHKFSWKTERWSNRWHLFLSLAAHDNSLLSKRALWKQAASSPVHARKRERLALITSRQKTPLTNSKQGARSLLWLTGNTHTHLQKVLFLSGWGEILTLREIICRWVCRPPRFLFRSRWQTQMESNWHEGQREKTSERDLGPILPVREADSSSLKDLSVWKCKECTETNKHTHTHTHTQIQHTSNGLPECCIPHLIGSEKIRHRAPSKVNFSQRPASQSRVEARSPGPRPPEIGTDNLLLELKQWSHTLTQMTLHTQKHIFSV